MTKDQFTLIVSPEDDVISLWNLSLISSLQVKDGELQIRMNNGDTLNLRGDGKEQLLLHVLDHTVLPDGTKSDELLSILKSRLARPKPGA